MWIASGCFSIVVLLVFALPVASQQPAPKVDTTPLARPSPLAVIRIEDPATLLAKVADVLRRGGFLLRQTDTRDQFIDATRPDSAPSKDYDRVLVWLERDFQDPSRTVKVFFIYGRFQELLAGRRDIFRVVIPPHFEEERVGSIKQSLIALGG